MKRRKFLLSASALPALPLASAKWGAVSPDVPKSDQWGALLPTRPLGKTGESITLLGVGGFHAGWTEERDAAEVIETAMEGGIRFFDTAEGYQEGESERRYGKYLTPKYRDDIYLMTKTTARDAKTAQGHLDGSLSRLKTDYLDLYQIHSLSDPEDVDNRLANGVLDVLLKAQEEGKVRHLGFTGHRNPESFLRMLELTASDDPFVTCQMPVNAVDPHAHSFISQVLPVLEERNIALLAMKTLADGRFFAMKRRPGQRIRWQTENPVIPTELSIRDALHFAWSFPISTLITGAENASLLREKIAFATTFSEPFNEDQMAAILEKTRAFPADKVEYYKRPVS